VDWPSPLPLQCRLRPHRIARRKFRANKNCINSTITAAAPRCAAASVTATAASAATAATAAAAAHRYLREAAGAVFLVEDVERSKTHVGYFLFANSGQVSPIESSTSAIATAAASGETPDGGFWRAIAKARSRACGSARSCIQPCSSYSWMACASLSAAIAYARSVRIAGRRCFVVNI
jgi:hypothetical protein